MTPTSPPPGRAPRRTARLATGVALAAALTAGAAATAQPAAADTWGTRGPAVVTRTVNPANYFGTPGDTRMSSALTSRATSTRFGTAFGGVVLDAWSNKVVWQRNSGTAYLPASTTKLVTATNALTVLGPDRRYRTTVTAGGAADQLVLVGSGDPMLSTAQLDAIAATTASTLRTRGTTAPKVYVDDDAFPTPTLAYGWKSSYVPDSIQPVRALVRDQRSGTDTSADVGRYLVSRLVANGLTGATYVGRANSPSGAAVIASSDGAPVSTAVSRMLLVSDNEIAEALHKLVGIARGKGATWDGARSAQSGALSLQSLSFTALYDGSGLSRADRMTPLQLARIVDRGVDTRNTALWPMRSTAAMPTAGRTGTLSASSDRFVTAESRCAVDKVWAKTGRLSDVVSLSGYTTGADGRLKVFAFVVNGKSSTTALKQGVDMLAATVNGCY